MTRYIGTGRAGHMQHNALLDSDIVIQSLIAHTTYQQ